MAQRTQRTLKYVLSAIKDFAVLMLLPEDDIANLEQTVRQLHNELAMSNQEKERLDETILSLQAQNENSSMFCPLSTSRR
jgi:hypothetical protein